MGAVVVEGAFELIFWPHLAPGSRPGIDSGLEMDDLDSDPLQDHILTAGGEADWQWVSFQLHFPHLILCQYRLWHSKDSHSIGQYVRIQLMIWFWLERWSRRF